MLGLVPFHNTFVCFVSVSLQWLVLWQVGRCSSGLLTASASQLAAGLQDRAQVNETGTGCGFAECLLDDNTLSPAAPVQSWCMACVPGGKDVTAPAACRSVAAAAPPRTGVKTYDVPRLQMPLLLAVLPHTACAKASVLLASLWV